MFQNNPDFYPTPNSLIDRMLSGVEFDKVKTVLEPSAGKGDLVSKVIDKMRTSHGYYGSREFNCDIDTVELDDNLQHILKGKGYRVVHNDFLSFQTYKKYDLIVANPPFSQGDKHLLKMIELQQNGGGIIVCLLNAETLRNPCTITRSDLLDKLDKYNASIEFIPNAFVDAERQTYVEVALIKLEIPHSDHYSVILDDLKKTEQFRDESLYGNDNLISADFLKGIVEQYNFEIRAGLKLISEWRAINRSSFNGVSLSIVCDNSDKNSSLHNSFIKKVRMKYWKALFELFRALRTVWNSVERIGI